MIFLMSTWPGGSGWTPCTTSSWCRSSASGKEIGDDALFTVGLQNYHFKNIESFFNISYDTICKIQKPRSVATSCQDILMEYFREHEMLDAAVDGRMTILPPAGQ